MNMPFELPSKSTRPFCVTSGYKIPRISIDLVKRRTREPPFHQVGEFGGIHSAQLIGIRIRVLVMMKLRHHILLPLFDWALLGAHGTPNHYAPFATTISPPHPINARNPRSVTQIRSKNFTPTAKLMQIDLLSAYCASLGPNHYSQSTPSIPETETLISPAPSVAFRRIPI